MIYFLLSCLFVPFAELFFDGCWCLQEVMQRIGALEEELAESMKEKETLRTLSDERKKKYLEDNARLEKVLTFLFFFFLLFFLFSLPHLL